MIRTVYVLICASTILTAGDTVAVVIGISPPAQAAHGSGPRFGDRDGVEFGRYLGTPDADDRPQPNTRLLTNAKATRSAVESALGWLSSRSTRDDQVIVYFSGGGVKDDAGRLYIMPWDAYGGQSSAISVDEMLGYFRRKVRAKQVVLFLEAACDDQCQDNPIASSQNTLGTIMSSSSSEPAEPGAEHTLALLAASPNERSYEDQSMRQGIFTIYLLEGLRGRADGDSDGVVTTGELRRFVVDAVGYHTGGDQHPTVLPGFEPGLALARSRLLRPAGGDLTEAEAARIRAQSKKDDGAEVFFSADSAVAAAGITSMVRLASELKRNPDYRCILEGHSDTHEHAPVTRSEQRAGAIRSLLLELGVKPEQIAAVPLGSTRPRSANAAEAGRLANRRVTSLVLKGGMSIYTAQRPEALDDLPTAERPSAREVADEFFPRDRLAPLRAIPASQWENVFFAANSAAVVTSIPVLLQLAEVLKRDPELECTLTGHADAMESSWEAISLRRAVAVRNFLLESGAPQDRIKTAAASVANPVAPAFYETGKLLNRRVSIGLVARPKP